MATHDYVIANGTGAAVRSDLNNALAAIVSNNSSATEPTTTYAYMWWADTTAGQLKLRNAADDGWIVIQELDGTMLMEDGTVGAPGLAFASDLDTGFYRPAANELGIATNGTNAIYINSSGNVGIGTTSPSNTLDVNGIIATNSAFYAYNATNDGLGIWYNPGAAGVNQLTARLGGSDRLTIDSSGRLLVNTSSSIESTSKLQVKDGSLNIYHASAAANAGYAILFTTDGSGTAQAQAKIEALQEAASTSGGRLTFSTSASGSASPTERFRISQDGSFWAIGTNTFEFATTAVAGSSELFRVRNAATNVGTGTTAFVVLRNGNTLNANGSYTTISDAKLKENIVDAGSQWDDLKAIKIRNWNFKEGIGYETHRQIGPIAQELEEVCPGLVCETLDQDDEGNETGEVTKGVNQSVLYMKAVKALQEAMERIEALEAKVAALEGA